MKRACRGCAGRGRGGDGADRRSRRSSVQLGRRVQDRRSTSDVESSRGLLGCSRTTTVATTPRSRVDRHWPDRTSTGPAPEPHTASSARSSGSSRGSVAREPGSGPITLAVLSVMSASVRGDGARRAARCGVGSRRSSRSVCSCCRASLTIVYDMMPELSSSACSPSGCCVWQAEPADAGLGGRAFTLAALDARVVAAACRRAAWPRAPCASA